jgi:hypothetical protein
LDGAGKKLRSETVLIGPDTVHMEVMVLANALGDLVDVTGGRLHVLVQEPLSIDDNGGSITIDGSVSILGTVTVDTELPAAAVLADNDPNPTTSRVGANLLIWDGATWDRAPGNSVDGQLVNLGANNDVTVTGTVAVDTELPAASALADNDPNPTTSRVGANLLIWDGATWDRAPGNSTDGLLVNLGANNDVTITGTVTVTATNLDIRDLTHVSDSVQIGDGTLTATVRNTGASDSLNVAIVDAAGAQITSFGGGVQYTEGDVDASITGTAAMWEDAGNTLRPASAATPFPVTIISGSSAGTEYTEGDVDASITGTAGMMEDAGNTLRPLQGSIADGLLVNLGANNDVTITGTVTVDTELPSAAALADNDPNPTTSRIGANLLIWDGATWDRAPGSSANGLLVDLGANNDVTVTGSVTVVATDLDIRDLTHVSDSVKIGDGTLTATVRDTGTSDSLNVAIVDAAGAHITSFGGGVQYTEGDVDLSITGTAAMMEDAGNTLRPLQGSIADGLLVNLGANNDVTITGTVTVDTELSAATVLADNDPNPTTSRIGANLLIWDGANWDRAPGTSANGLLVDLGANNDVTVTGTVTVDTELPSATALADNDPNPTTSRIGANLLIWDGATWDRAPGTSADGLLVNLGANNDVTITGTVTVAATDLDIRDLTHVSDSVKIGDGTLTATVRDTGTNDSLNVAIVDAAGHHLIRRRCPIHRRRRRCHDHRHSDDDGGCWQYSAPSPRFDC